MKYGLSGASVPANLPYAADVNRAATESDFSPLFSYAVFYRETIHGEVAGWWNAATVISADGGHGLGQITPPWNVVPAQWYLPYQNAMASIKILDRALENWLPIFQGADLLRLAAATYNAGYGNALAGHNRGNVDTYTTKNYAAGVLAYYNALLANTSLEAVAS